MLQEQIQTNFESHPQLFEEVLGLEKAEVSPEYLPMWNAENNACFPYFINYAKDEMSDALLKASNGDKDAIALLNASYEEYRTGLEADMSEYAPNLYELFVEAVGRGDSINAAMYVEEYISTVTSPPIQEDDDDD